MTEEEPNDFGGFGGTGGSSGGSGQRSTRDYKPYPEGVVNLMFDAMQANYDDYTWPLNPEDSEEIHEAHREKYDIPEDVTHYCVKQFAPFEIEADAIGTPVKVGRDQLQASVDAGYLTQEELEGMDFNEDDTVSWAPEGANSTPQTNLSKCLNGHHAEEIVERWGEGAKVRVMAAKRTQVEAAHQRHTNVRFYISTSETAALGRERARYEVGEISQEDFVEWAEENGYEDKV